MKIIISPSKTKKIGVLNGVDRFATPVFSEITEEIVKEISQWTVEDIECKFKLKREQAEKLSDFYKSFKKEKYGHAISTYTGIAYKEIHADELTTEEQNFMEENLRILSALYGVLAPFTELKEYRLDMVNSVFSEKSLYEIWKKEINDYFRNEDFIINLASKEYSKILSTDNIYNFEFYDEKDGKLKQISTNSKKMRGFTVNYIIKNRITDVTLLKNISLNGYKYNEEMSVERKYVYTK